MSKSSGDILSNLKDGSAHDDNEMGESGLYAVMVVNEHEHVWIFNTIDVYLVNDTGAHFRSVMVLTGAFASDDDTVIETGKRVTEKEDLQPHSVREIGKADTGELDYVVWYDLDMTDSNGNINQYQFSLPKYRNAKEKTYIPLLERQGHRIDLKPRPGASIDDWVATHDMKGRSLDYRKQTSYPDFSTQR